jgi:hypothetical protein
LPKGASEDQQIIELQSLVFSVPQVPRVVDCQPGGKKFIADNFLPCAGQSQSEVFDCWMAKVNGMNHVPNLAQGRRAVP